MHTVGTAEHVRRGVSAGVLKWGKRYVWEVTIRDTSTQETGILSNLSFLTVVRRPVGGSQLATRGANGQEFHRLAGNWYNGRTGCSFKLSPKIIKV
ncbi:hypothetical protein [Streptosporangium longisporum]|uniref:Uncharacterized protein n=1 Tax=Streptosporangium longisporum TaxID=46187 RepID=A0ABP6L372_9ACTN